ncbi:MAG: DUF6512 family protein [Patescibacteria group bacterium]|nr:DUF6512 family protein [Patescibacteria group bacterium]MDD5716044.1 DUF6512 family protein [Patescibacteria group bacterium]
MEKIKKIEIWGAAWGIIIGSLLHFTYQWFGEARVIGLFSAINESVWEHTKLLFFPVLFFTIVELRYVRDRNRLLLAKVAESVFGILFIISFFYTYTSALGVHSFFPVDIASFFAAVVVGKCVSYRIIIGTMLPSARIPWFASASVVAIIMIVFFIATFSPPDIPLFTEAPEPAQAAATNQRKQIEIEYPEFRNFENQESFAGKSVKEVKDGNDLYVAYMVLGSGLPIAEATCFRVDWMRRVYKIGEFPIGVDSYAGYRDIDPKTCNGKK